MIQLRRITPGVYAYGFTQALVIKQPNAPKHQRWLVFVAPGVGTRVATLHKARVWLRKNLGKW